MLDRAVQKAKAGLCMRNADLGGIEGICDAVLLLTDLHF
jgi:hypothetical protein